MIIKTENLTYTYSSGTPFEKVAVDDVNIEIQEGDFVGVIGHTGSGKSTLIQHFNGLLKPTSGKVYVNGKDIWANKGDVLKVRFEVGLVFQYPEHQLFEETVYKDIAFGPGNMGLTKREIDDRVNEAMAFTGLSEEFKEKSPFDLSGGQKRRVAIAGVIAMRPKVLILDEPTAGLDPKGRDKILNQIKEYHKKTGSTVLLVSHSMEDIARFAKKVLVMNKSKVFDFDTTENIFKRYDKLKAMGLNVPQVTNVFHTLIKNGVDVPDNVYTTDYAKERILELLSKKGGVLND